MRLRIGDTIEELVKQELEAALGAVKSARVGDTRQGYRHGTRDRTLTTSLGPQNRRCRRVVQVRDDPGRLREFGWHRSR